MTSVMGLFEFSIETCLRAGTLLKTRYAQFSLCYAESCSKFKIQDALPLCKHSKIKAILPCDAII